MLSLETSPLRSYYFNLQPDMKYLLPSLALVGTSWCFSVPTVPPKNISEPIGSSFVSYSIEFSWFPEFAGKCSRNLAHPNGFSHNLLSNFKSLTGDKPYVRVGGNTQDNALYDPDLKAATNRTFGNPDIQYPTSMTYGKAFFESYQTFQGVKFSHGFNLGANATNGGFDTLRATLPLACKAINRHNFAHWEVGNEADHYGHLKSNRPPIRDDLTWNAAAYVADWKNRTDTLVSIYRGSCKDKPFKLLAPSFAGLRWLEDTFADGLNRDNRIKAIGTHHYIASSLDPSVTLQRTLMNHTQTAIGLASQTQRKNALASLGLPYIIGEGNSLFSQGRRGSSDVFGAALWSIDFSLLAASLGIHRVHFHQGVDYIYSAWQPVHYKTIVPATKPPYYGHIATAATLGNTREHRVQVANIPVTDETESAYAIYRDGRLAHVAILNMAEYNSSTTTARPSKEYSISISGRVKTRKATVRRLLADGSDATSGISWDGYSYNYELDEGRPVRLRNLTNSYSEAITIKKRQAAAVGFR
ncbi:hypothetical protein ACJZ2D_001403 [Fusarium nematophilum]